MQNPQSDSAKWSLGRMIIGIISIVLFFFIAFQSCAVGFGNSLSGNGELSGTFGIFTAMLILISGIIGVVTRNSAKAGGPITCCVFYWFGFFLSRIGSGHFSDLRIWGILAFFFGCIYLFSTTKKRSSQMLALIFAIIYFLLGIA